MRKDGGAMARESSDLRRGSATVTKWMARIVASLAASTAAGAATPTAFFACAVAPALLAGTAACATWTGSVGAVLAKGNTDGRLFVREVPPGMGAARAGLVVGDEVVAIGGRPVDKMTPPEVHEALAGKVGTVVKVTVLRAGVRLEYSIERGPLAGT